MGGLSSSAVQSSLCLWAHQGLSWAQFLFVHENCANPTFPSAQFYLREWIELKNKQTNKQKPKPPPPPPKKLQNQKSLGYEKGGGLGKWSGPCAYLFLRPPPTESLCNSGGEGRFRDGPAPDCCSRAALLSRTVEERWVPGLEVPGIPRAPQLWAPIFCTTSTLPSSVGGT